MGEWKTATMFRHYAIVSSTDNQQAVQKLEQARASASEAKAVQIEAENALARMPVKSVEPS